MKAAIDTHPDSSARASLLLAAITGLCVFAMLAPPAWSHDVQPHPHAEGSKAIPSTVPPDDVCRHHGGPCEMDHRRPEHGSLGNIGAKLADPTSNIWAMAMSFNAPAFYDGDLNSGSPEVGGAVAIQPIMPFPLYGEGADQWKLLTRPVIPVIFTEPIPEGPLDEFAFRGGLGDTNLLTALSPPGSMMDKLPRGEGHWIFGAGVNSYWPTATDPTSLGKGQFGIGPALVFGWKNKSLTAVSLTSYTFGIGSSGDQGNRPDLSQMSLLYALIFNLPSAWQIGLNPTISYNDKAPSANKWKVPVGLFGGRTIKIGRVPVNIRLGLEYSVVSPDAFGQRAQIRLQIQPVIPGLVQKPIFGGGK